MYIPEEMKEYIKTLDRDGMDDFAHFVIDEIWDIWELK